ncbi:MAG: hypothetical protein EZS28_053731 [Streblomastix strix]|uniref:Uncharacterized protein n=1 Tax=Streblomastix strix TaxID=222440 RepID=A0A5J4R594_9EUKA|nr:MAG: hypothetical protein EZS28_053731 [Streblomastix strix]
MDSNPRTLTFFINDKEQPNYISNLPDTIRFWVNILTEGSSFKLLQFERLLRPAAKHGPQSKELKWGEHWFTGDIIFSDSDSESDPSTPDSDD